MSKELGLRIITGLTGVAVILAALYSSYYGLWFFCVIISMFSLWEILGIMNVHEKRYRWIAMLLGAEIWIALLLGLLANDRGVENWGLDWDIRIAIMIFPILGIISLFNPKETQPFETLSAILFSFIYCYLPLVLLYKLSLHEGLSSYNYQLPLGILFLTWVLDSFAYFGGRLLGKHPLYPRISPKKSWEGAICGAVFCLGLGFALETYLKSPIYSWLIIAVIISISSQLGDLVESMFKRSRQIKDSGKLLPGHGGMLDRFDGIFLSVPFIYLYFSFL